MRPQLCASLGVLLLLVSGTSATAGAITLQLTGGQYEPGLNTTIGVSNNVNQVSVSLGNMLSIHTVPPIGQPQPINFGVYVHGAFMVDTGGSTPPKEADFNVFIPVSGSYIRMDQTEDVSGTASGTAAVSFLPGTDFSMLPPWASTLTASVNGVIQDGHMNDLATTLTLTGSTPQPVPEPATLGLYLLALAGVGLYRVRPRRPA